MPPKMLRASLVLVFAIAMAGASSADLTKLDPLARAALARLRAGEDVARLAAERSSVTASGELDVFVRGSVTRAELEAAGARVRTEVPAAGIFTAFIPVDAIEWVAALPGVQLIRGAAPVQLELDVSTSEIGVAALRGAGPGFAGANGAGVLIGDVDSGVDINHGDFDDPAGNTRLIRLWDQTETLNPGPPSGYTYGREWLNTEIDAGQCTEDDDVGHGTHVLGIAGGDGSQTGGSIPQYRYAGVAPKADLVMIKTDFNDSKVVDGVRYCFDLATARGQNAVVNLSLGSQYGPHDGTDTFEAGLAAMTGPGRIIVKSAGNDRASSRHAEIVAAGAGTTATMVVSGSAAGRVVWIDGYYESTDNILVKVKTPDGTTIGPILRGNLNAAYPGQHTPSGTVYLENGYLPTQTGDYEVYCEITTASGENMNGTWEFTFIPVSAPNGQVDLWEFFTSSGVTSDWVVGLQDQELISEPGNAEEIITVAAYVTKVNWTDCSSQPRTYSSPPTLGAIAPFSSPGPTRDGRQKPDIAAPGMGIASTTSFDVFPSCGIFYLNDALNHRIDQGTSMAAPHVTGAAALLLQNFGPLTPSQVKAYLFSHAQHDAQTGAVWGPDFGNGKLFLDSSVEVLLSLFQAAFVSEGVELRWQFGDPGRFTRVALERAESVTGPWRAVDSERRLEGGVTVVLDRSAAPSGTLFYRLVATPADGSAMVFGPLEIVNGVTLARFELASVRPNPTRGVARVDFTVPREAPIRLSVFDLQGREVAVLADGSYRPGRYQAAWNGAGSSVRAGLYFVRLSTPSGVLMQRVTLTP